MRSNLPRFLQPNRWACYLLADLGACSGEAYRTVERIEHSYARTAEDLHVLWRKTDLSGKLWYLSSIGLGPFDHPYRKAITKVFAPLLCAQRDGAIAPVVASYLRGDYATAKDLREDLHFVLRKQALPASKNPRAVELLEILLMHEKDQRGGFTDTLTRYHRIIELPWLILAMAQEHLYGRGFAALLLSVLPNSAATWLSGSVLNEYTDMAKFYSDISQQLTAAFPQLPCPQDERIRQCQVRAFGGYLPGTYEPGPGVLVPSRAGALHGPRVVRGREQW